MRRKETRGKFDQVSQEVFILTEKCGKKPFKYLNRRIGESRCCGSLTTRGSVEEGNKSRQIEFEENERTNENYLLRSNTTHNVHTIALMLESQHYK